MTDKLDRLIMALDRLPPLARIAFLLSATDGFSHREISFRIGISVAEVEGLLADALFLLRRMMDEDEPPP